MLKRRVQKKSSEARSGKMVGFLPTPSLREELERIAEFEGRSLSDTAFRLVLKGLDTYYQDKDLRGPRHLPLRKGKAE